MTQPAVPADSNTGQILATAAIALALIALEQQVRQQVQDDTQTALAAFTAYVLIAIAVPAASIATGLQVMSLAGVHQALTKAIDTARTATSATVQAGYDSATALTWTKLGRELDLTGALPYHDSSDGTLARDIDTMFGHAQSDLQNSIRAAYDSSTDQAARVVAVRAAADTSIAALQNRAAAAAGTAVQRGSTDAAQAIFTDYQTHTGSIGLMKRWRTTSARPCGMCEALNGTLVGVNAEFDYRATTVDKDLRPVWRNLSGPPRHPNCRCQLELVAT